MKKIRMILCTVLVIMVIIVAMSASMLVSSIKGNDTYKTTQAKSNLYNNVDLPVIEVKLISSSAYNSESATQNTKLLQNAIDEVSSSGGGTVYIPAGVYYFNTAGKNDAKTEDYVIKCKDNVTVMGNGISDESATILKPYGNTDRGLDMFYYNAYRDSGFTRAEYLINADFKNFIIDAEETNAATYTTAGKGFMINIFKDCDWENVIVKNTDATGFGMDCPINSTIKKCIAINCGKKATTSSWGASGFGIGTGYSNEEYMHIEDCIATGNKKFGFFFEHQGRFRENNYKATSSKGFVVSNCEASGNLYDMGGNRANDVTYENCTVNNFFNFENNSRRINLINCKSNKKYEDVGDSAKYYYGPVYWAANNGISAGVSDTEFLPSNDCTRNQAVKFLWRMNGMQGDVVLGNEPTIDTGYPDVTGTSDSAQAIKWATDTGIANGLYSGNFNGDNACSRAAFITMLWRYAGKPEVECTTGFTDVDDGKWCSQAVKWGVKTGIINGTGVTEFNPDGAIKRADAITMLYRYNNTKGNTFNIIYNLDGGIVQNENPNSYIAGTDCFAINNPTKKGYTFKGWTGSSNTTGGAVGVGNYIPVKDVSINLETIGNCGFSSNWKANSYTISFNANGGTGEMEDEVCTYDSQKYLLENKFVRNGYEFKNWSLTPDGNGTCFSNKEIVKNLTDEDGKNIILYAQWTAINAEYTVEHWKENLNGEYIKGETETLATHIETLVSPDVKQYEGFTSPSKQETVINESGINIVYKYSRNKYRVTITKGKGIEEVSGDGTYMFEQNVKLNAITQKGYENIQWGGYTTSSEFFMPAKDLNITVNATAIEYKISYELNGGDSIENPEKYNVETETFKLKNPTRTGYTFLGWTGSNGNIPQKDVSVEKGTIGNLVYKANWKANSYTISFNANGGTGEMEDEVCTYDSQKYLLENKFVRNGYEFKNWSLTPDGNGTCFSNKEIVKNLTDEDGKNIILYAQWTAINAEYTVEHWKENLNGEYIKGETETLATHIETLVSPDVKQYEGFTSPSKQETVINESGINIVYKYSRNKYRVTITKGKGIEEVSGDGTYMFEQNVKLNAITQKGYENIQWGGYTTSSEFFMPAKDLNITVNATAIEYKISYELNGGDSIENPEKYNVETETFKLKNPTRTGYTFLGWTGSNGNTPQKDVSVENGTTGNLEYKANWKIDEEEESKKLETHIEYSNNKPTNKKVKVYISSNNKIVKVSNGWTIMSDGKTIFKEFDSNTIENVIIEDVYNNRVVESVEITNIDKTKPNVSIQYQKSDKKIIVILTANEEIQKIEGWTLSEDTKVLKKIYEENTKETVIVKDIAGNEQEQLIVVDGIIDGNDNIYKNEDERTEDNKEQTSISEGKNNVDNTVSNKGSLPKAGRNIGGILGITTIIATIYVIITYKKYKKLKDIK